MPTRRKKTVPLADVLARALTDKTLLRDLQARPQGVQQTLARRKLALSRSDLKALEQMIPGKTQPPPPPPPWHPVMHIARAIMTALNARMDKIEKMAKGTARRTGRAAR